MNSNLANHFLVVSQDLGISRRRNCNLAGHYCSSSALLLVIEEAHSLHHLLSNLVLSPSKNVTFTWVSKHCFASSKISAAKVLPSKICSLVRAQYCLLFEIMPSWILLLLFSNTMNFLSYTCSCWSSPFISLWQYNWNPHYWGYCSVCKAIFTMQICLPILL